MEAMNYWLNDLSSKSLSTRTKYQTSFQQFCTYANKSPNELIAQRKQDMKAEDPREARNCENLLKGFINKLRSEEYSPVLCKFIMQVSNRFLNQTSFRSE